MYFVSRSLRYTRKLKAVQVHNRCKRSQCNPLGHCRRLPMGGDERWKEFFGGDGIKKSKKIQQKDLGPLKNK